MLDVVTIGSATLDIFLKSDQFKIDTSHSDGVFLCERYEGKIEAQEVVMTSGGGATNSAVSYARKGLQVAPVIEMGRDPAAEMVLLDLGREHVDLSFVIQEPDETTAVSVILLSSGPPSSRHSVGTSAFGSTKSAFGQTKSARQGGNSIVTYRGASRMLTVSDIPFDKIGMALKPDRWIHLTNVGGNMEVVEAALAWAKEKERKVFWNPGAAELRNNQQSTINYKQFMPDVLQLNREEAARFFSIDFENDDVWKSEHCPTPPETIGIITNGAAGGRVCHHGACTWYEGIKTKMMDSTGAGDAFGSGFVSGLILGKSVDEAIEWGKKQAASVVSFIGAKKGLLTREELEISN